jgi:amidohydrolase
MITHFDGNLQEAFRQIREQAEAMREELIAIRRDIHAHPEQRFEEVRTAGIAAEHLKKLGIDVRTGVGKTGVVGVLRGGLGEGRIIGIRCDMDALPVQEQNDAPYRSCVDGSMHACGHDVHTTVAIGTARVLAGMRDRFRGAVKFVFQPSEENPCGAVCGALAMIGDGVLENPPMDAILSLHCWPELTLGQVGVGAGPAMAGSQAFRITMIGAQSHCSTPQKGRDAILGAAEVVSSIHHIIPRRTDPSDMVALNIGFIEGGSKFGTIAGKTVMEGSVRAISKEMLEFIMDRVRDTVEGVSRILDLKNEITIEGIYPPTINDPRLNDIVSAASTHLLGPENVIVQTKCPMTSEDFSHFSDRIPAFYMKLGVFNDSLGIRFPLHSDRFDVDERCIGVGVSVLAASALAYLNGQGG